MIITNLRGTTTTTLLNTAAALASNARALGSAITLTDAGYLRGDVIFDGTFSVTPTAYSSLRIWFLREDGSGDYEDGDASTTPIRDPDVVIPLRAVTTAQNPIQPDIILPPGPFKTLAVNDESGQQISSGWTVKVRPSTYQGTS